MPNVNISVSDPHKEMSRKLVSFPCYMRERVCYIVLLLVQKKKISSVYRLWEMRVVLRKDVAWTNFISQTK